jgi:hypothetical protein
MFDKEIPTFSLVYTRTKFILILFCKQTHTKTLSLST